MERQSPPAEGALTEEKPVNVHAHSWDSSADEATFAREPSARGRRPVNGAAKPFSGGRIDRGKASERPRAFAGFVGPRNDIGSRRGFGSAKDAVHRWHKRFSTEKNHTPREQIWQGRDQ